jgi:membrane-associated phospholipid phosphatase
MSDGTTPDRGRRSALIGLAVFSVGTVVLVAVNGLMLTRDVIFLWLIVGLLAVSAADLRGWARGVIFDWLPFFAILFAYDTLRGRVGQNPLFEPHVLPQIHVDEFLFGGVPSVQLQERFYDPGILHWYDVAAWAVYLSHFFVTVAIAAVLWRVARPMFLRFRAMVLAVTAAAFVTYALFPAVPPWMASADGVIGPVGRVVGGVWDQLGVDHAAAIWDRGSDLSNEVAAIPSLHTAFPVLILCFFWGAGRWARLACLAYALAMSLTLVYTGEHYVTDVILGWIYAIAGYLAVSRAYEWWAVRARERSARPRDTAEAGLPDLGAPEPAQMRG